MKAFLFVLLPLQESAPMLRKDGGGGGSRTRGLCNRVHIHGKFVQSANSSPAVAGRISRSTASPSAKGYAKSDPPREALRKPLGA